VLPPDSGSPRHHASEAYGSTEPAPSTLQEFQQELPKRLELSSADRPLIVFLDSPDQLAGGEGTNLSWLPSDLPGSVRLVTATRPGPFLDGLASRLPESLVIELDRMPADEGETLLDSWLQESGRTLTPGQRGEIPQRFEASGSPLTCGSRSRKRVCGPPHARMSGSATTRPRSSETSMTGSKPSTGPMLVGRALGFLAYTYERLGLSEDELLDALTADEETWAEFTAGAEWEMPMRRLPVVVWSRLYFDLAPYLSPRASEGASLLSFFHKELADAAQERYVEGRAAHMHDALTNVMHGLARGKDAGPREWKGSAHALAELPFHLTRAERWDDLFVTLTDFTYLKEKAKHVAVVTSAGAEVEDARIYNGVLALIDDYDRALAAFPTE
jgi:hypothetical protein